MRTLVVCSLIAVALAATPAAAVPTQVSFSARIADTSGPVEGFVELGFRLIDGTTVVWEEQHPAVYALGGLVFVALGSVSPLDDRVFAGAELQLELTIRGEVSSPRLPILAVPYALRAARALDADRLGGLLPAAFAAADHQHDARYLPRGSRLQCPSGHKATAIAATGDLECASDLDTQYQAAPGGGLEQSGTTFGIAPGGVTAARLATGAVTRDALAGTEVLVYLLPAGCAGGVAGTLTVSGANCVTDACGLLFRGCGGGCGQNGPQLCTPQALGHLLSPLAP